MPSLKARLKLTSACKNDCWYCYSEKDEGKMDANVISYSISKLASIYRNNKDEFSRVKIALSGGDPFTNSNIIYATKLIKNIFKEIPHLLFAEVCKYSDIDVVEEYVKLGGVCMVSLNEDESDEIIELCNKIKKFGSIPLLNMVLTNRNINFIPSVVQRCLKEKIPFRINHLFDQTLESEMEEKILNCLDAIFYIMLLYDFKLPISVPTFGNLNPHSKSNSYCGYGKNFLYIRPNGSVSRCLNESPISDIFDTNILDKIRNKKDKTYIDNFDIECIKCNAFELCKGGCNYSNINRSWCNVYRKMAEIINTFNK